MGIRDRPITPRSPWQNGHVERLIGSIRRECLDHVVVLGKGTSGICWPITRPTTMGCARTLHSTRIPRSIALRRQPGVSHQSLGSAVSIGTRSDGIIGRYRGPAAQEFDGSTSTGCCRARSVLQGSAMRAPARGVGLSLLSTRA
jgi:hypothetical protein